MSDRDPPLVHAMGVYALSVDEAAKILGKRPQTIRNLRSRAANTKAAETAAELLTHRVCSFNGTDLTKAQGFACPCCGKVTGHSFDARIVKRDPILSFYCEACDPLSTTSRCMGRVCLENMVPGRFGVPFMHSCGSVYFPTKYLRYLTLGAANE